MRDFRTFRLLDAIENRIIHTALNQISTNIALFIEKRSLSLFVLIPEQDERHLVYLISEELRKLILSFQNNVNIVSAGISIGFISRNTFFLSLEGAEFFLNENIIPDQNILNVSNEGEKILKIKNPECTTDAVEVAQIEAGEWLCTVCNYLPKSTKVEDCNINYDYYITKSKRIIDKIKLKGRKSVKEQPKNQITLW